MESSIWSKSSRRASMQLEPGRYFSMTGCARIGHTAAVAGFGERSALPGVEAYRIYAHSSFESCSTITPRQFTAPQRHGIAYSGANA